MTHWSPAGNFEGICALSIRWTIRRKLGAGLGAVAAVFLIAIGITLVFSSSAESSWKNTLKWNRAMKGGAEQIEGTQAQMAAQALYAATFDPKYKAEFEDGVEHAEEGAKAVQAIGNPGISKISARALEADRVHDATVHGLLFPAVARHDHAAALAALRKADKYVRVPLAAQEKIESRVDALREADVKSAESAADRARLVGLVAALIGTLLSAVIAFLIARSCTRSLPALQERFSSLTDNCIKDLGTGLAYVADGDLTFEATPVTTPISSTATDEIGDLSRTFDEMLGNVQSGLESYNAMRNQLHEMIGEVARTSVSVSSASTQMASTSEEAGRAVSEIANAVGGVAEGAEQQVRMIEQARRSAEETTEAASTARGVAVEGASAAAKATEAMQGVRDSSESVSEAINALAAKSEQIGGIVETITGIAGQTNLLALNAAIEAARAGEQGRGFAVVAEEVRKLAEESQKAAASIAELIEQIQAETQKAVEVVEEGAQRTEDGAAIVEQAREAFAQIAASVEAVNERIQGIAAATSEVAAVAEQTSASTEQVSASTEETSASTQEIAASAQELATGARELEQLVARFKLAA